MEILTKVTQPEKENFVTVVSVGNDVQPVKNENSATDLNNLGYVTVLTIGDSEQNANIKDVIEEVLVYRLPGERLGFGLKFEGGTKASEFVKRLFIQSCAPDSPASRVKSSWGKLAEGDEVLEIDCIPVNSMTRIDCVRCLKDSNVVIKLLIRHFSAENKQPVKKTRSIEDIPLVISAEKKRPPPPPPPVPPRKIPRKLIKNNYLENKENLQEVNNNPVPSSRQINNDTNEKIKKFQSPRSSGRSSYSPDIPRRDRRFSDGSLGPPDAEVYMNLISQESTQSLSESDDTGSTISTVIDRFGSFPTTTTSSFAGSLPSTPTSLQKKLDLTNILNFDDEELTVNKSVVNNIQPYKSDEIEKIQQNEDGIPLQPPSCFQDAPLSYGNEDMRVIKTKTIDETDSNEINGKVGEENKISKKPPVPPRCKDSISNIHLGKEPVHDENMNISSLPRLVDFLPKSSTKESIEVMKLFLENERRDHHLNDEEFTDVELYNNGIDLYSSKWSLSPQLATIGEVEEEGQDFNFNRLNSKSTPIVIVENVDSDNGSEKQRAERHEDANYLKEINENMEIPPSDSRQPPDGHEFPDYVEQSKSISQYETGYVSLEKENKKMYKSVECINITEEPISDFKPNKTLLNKNSASNNDLSNIGSVNDDIKFSTSPEPTNLHTRSQSLIDMSSFSKQKNDRWTQMVEHRRKGLSKLKGLVIPEHIAENENVPVVNIPEIKSQDTPNFVPVIKSFNSSPPSLNSNHFVEPVKSNLVSAPWSTSTTNTLPKYSPAFKRKTLQVYPLSTNPTKAELSNKQTKIEMDLENLSDPPKSLESITSPTRSDCSFDYVSSSKKSSPKHEDGRKKDSQIINKFHRDLGKSEDESDNDSAVSSSQSSYISRCSPPASPTITDYETINLKSEDFRLLKPSSVEAINRKNILASAKCRSGRDLKVGSPVIHRKYDESDGKTKNVQPDNKTMIDKVNNAFSDVDNIAKEIETIAEKPIPEIITKKEVVPLSNGTSPVASKLFDKETPKPLPVSTLPKNTFIPIKSPILPQPKTAVSRDLYKIDYRSSSLLKKPAPLSVNDLKKNFEKFDSVPPKPHKVIAIQPFVNSKQVKSQIEKTEIKISKQNVTTTKVPEKVKAIKEEVVITPKKRYLDETKVTEDLEEKTITLNLDSIGGSLGITLAGGTDYENKEVTVHRIRYASVAYQDGQLKKGDKIISINNHSTKGLTHAESMDLLKETTKQFVIVIKVAKEEPQSRRLSTASISSEIKSPVQKLEEKSVTHVVTLTKDGGAGLGFSIEGGKDSPHGDVPLLVKKIFQGGAADKSGELCVGDEILAINEINFRTLSRIEAWNLMKKLPDGPVKINIHR